MDTRSGWRLSLFYLQKLVFEQNHEIVKFLGNEILTDDRKTSSSLRFDDFFLTG